MYWIKNYSNAQYREIQNQYSNAQYREILSHFWDTTLTRKNIFNGPKDEHMPSD